MKCLLPHIENLALLKKYNNFEIDKSVLKMFQKIRKAYLEQYIRMYACWCMIRTLKSETAIARGWLDRSSWNIIHSMCRQYSVSFFQNFIEKFAVLFLYATFNF